MTSTRVRWKYLTLVTLPSVVAFSASPVTDKLRSSSNRNNVVPLVCSSASPLVLNEPIPDFSLSHKDVDEESILVSKSLSTCVLSHSPSVSSFTLVKGWSKESSLESLTNAVNVVVENNPILSGKAVAEMKREGKSQGWGASELRVVPGTFTPGTHPFVKTIDLRHIPRPRDLDEAGQLDYIYQHVAPHVRIRTVMDQVRCKLPLLGVTVVELPDDYACIHIDMSHCIGDLVTYFHIVKQISDIGQRKKIRPIDWDNPLIASHDLFPDEFTERDINRSYGTPFFLGILQHFPTMFLRRKQCMLLSREKIKAKVDEYNAQGGEPVSTNDVVTAALCDANRSSSIFALTRSMRGITPGLDRNTGGNLHCEVPFQRCAGRDPHTIRHIIKKGRYFDSDEMPFLDSVGGRIGRITNCVVTNMNLSFGGAETVCSCPPKAFLDFCPLDAAIIFGLNKNTYGVIHNFEEMTNSKLLDDLCVTGQLLPMMHI